jgi:leucyl aminopeptidase (aminopeptidase T)
MTDHSRIFAVASDEALVDLIDSVRTRLVVIAPASTKSVADALARRLDDLGQLSVTVILDADSEVYRLSFGNEHALDAIRAAGAKNLFNLREQPGVRIHPRAAGCRLNGM